MRLRDRFRDDARDAEVDEERGRQDARLDVGSDRDDRSPEVGGAELAHRDRIGGVRLDHMRERARELLHRFRIGVDAEHLAAEHHELGREGAAEPPEPADEELLRSSQ